MNPVIWGPMLWGIMADIANYYDSGIDHTKEYRDIVISFFKSMAFLLPCKYCRQSYRRYITNIPPEPYFQESQGITWLWQIHDQVNDKLDKKNSLSLRDFQKRLKSRTFMAGPECLFDFLFILGVNYDPQDHPLKMKFTRIMHETLPEIIPYRHAANALQKIDFQKDQLLTKEGYLNWLYLKRELYGKKSGLPIRRKDQYILQANTACSGV